MFFFFDSETSTVGSDAFPIAYGFIVTDSRLNEKARGVVRTPSALIDELYRYLPPNDILKVYAYNLHFDLAPLLAELRDNLTFQFFARSSSDWVSVSGIDARGRERFRFIDLAALQEGGLRKCGEIAGLPKLTGSFDFSKIRSPQTPLTTEEESYLMRDVEIMPAFLNRLSRLFDVSSHEFGRSILTVSQLSRRRARENLGCVKRGKRRQSVESLHRSIVKRESAESEDVMLLRRSCLRAGLSFVNAKVAGKTVKDVSIFDFESAYHFYIQHYRPPTRFHPCNAEEFATAAHHIVTRSPRSVLESPNAFNVAFHALVEFKALRLKSGSVWGGMSAGLFSRSKMALFNAHNEAMDATAEVQERDRSKRRDRTRGARFLFEKLISADVARIHLTETEFYAASLVYEWDEMLFIEGELTDKFTTAPDWIRLRSMALYEEKRALKECFFQDKLERLDILPLGMQSAIIAGTLSDEAKRELYGNVKVELNTLFGELIRERRAPEWIQRAGEPALSLGEIPDYDGKEYGYFTFGTRVAGLQRLMLVLIVTLADKCGATPLYGDTDSLAVKMTAEFQSVINALNTLRMAENRRNAEQIAGRTGLFFDTEYLGTFSLDYDCYEFCVTRPKAWGAFLRDGRAVVRVSGLKSEKLARLMAENPENFCLEDVIGWNCVYSRRVSKRVLKKNPQLFEMKKISGTDYLGNNFDIVTPVAILLVDATARAGNVYAHARDIDFLEEIGNPQDLRAKMVRSDGILFGEKIKPLTEEEVLDELRNIDA